MRGQWERNPVTYNFLYRKLGSCSLISEATSERPEMVDTYLSRHGRSDYLSVIILSSLSSTKQPAIPRSQRRPAPQGYPHTSTRQGHERYVEQWGGTNWIPSHEVLQVKVGSMRCVDNLSFPRGKQIHNIEYIGKVVSRSKHTSSPNSVPKNS